MSTPVDGTLNHTVSSCCFRYLLGNSFCCAVGTHTQAPRSHAQNVSNTLRSNVRSNVWLNLSASVMA